MIRIFLAFVAVFALYAGILALQVPDHDGWQLQHALVVMKENGERLRHEAANGRAN